MTPEPLTPEQALVKLRREWATTTDPDARGEIEQLARAVETLISVGLIANPKETSR